MKEQLSQSRGVSLDKLKLSVTGMKDNLRSLKNDMDSNMSGIREACQDFVLNLAPTMLNAQQQQQRPQTLNTSSNVPQQQPESQEVGLLQLQLDDKKKELNDAWATIKGLQTSNHIADSRLRDLVEVLQEIGSIQQVQKLLLQRESSISSIHKTSRNLIDETEVDHLRKNLDDKNELILRSQGKINVLEETIRSLREQSMLSGVGDVDVDTISNVSSLQVSMHSEQSQQSDFLSTVSRDSYEPSTPTMSRN